MIGQSPTSRNNIVTDILTLTLSPALDIATATAKVLPGTKLRCAAPRIDPGGGGINVARAVASLGGTAQAFVALAGPTGQRLARCLDLQRIPYQIFAGPGETRESLSVMDESTGQQFRFVLPGAVWANADVSRALKAIADAAPRGGIVVISGSQPPGVPDDFTALLCRRLAGVARVMIDTSGAALAQLITAPIEGLEVLRMDSEEAETVASHPLPDRRDTADFASSLIEKGVAKQIIVARGPDGSVLAEAGRRLFCKAANVPVKSKVGAGDSFMAGWVLARAQGQHTETALAHGVAAASAAVMTEATELCRAEDAQRLIAECPITPI